MVCSLNCSIVKVLLIQMVQPGGLYLLSTYIYTVISWIGSAIQLIYINKAQESYEQSEIGPVNVAFLIIFNFVCGSIILNEKRLYTQEELLYLGGCSLMCVAGIVFIIRKPKTEGVHLSVVESRRGLLNIPEGDLDEVQKVIELLQ